MGKKKLNIKNKRWATNNKEAKEDNKDISNRDNTESKKNVTDNNQLIQNDENNNNDNIESKEDLLNEVTNKINQLNEKYNKLLKDRMTNIEAFKKRKTLPKKLDSSIKKTQALIRKCKSISDTPIDQFEKDINKLNLRLYVAEIADAVAEAKLSKGSDVKKCILISSLMHQKYKEFINLLIPKLLTVFDDKTNHIPPYRNADDEKLEKEVLDDCKAINAKKRSTLRLLFDMGQVGLLESMTTIVDIVQDFINIDNEKDYTHSNLSLLVSFAKYGISNLCGILSTKIKSYYHITNQNVPAYLIEGDKDTQQKLAQSFNKYYNIISQRYIKLATKLNKLEKKNRKIQIMQGDIPASLISREEYYRESLQILKNLIESLSDSLDKEIPEIPESKDDDDETTITFQQLGGDAFNNKGLFDDEGIRSFYEDMPDLSLIVPPVLLKGEAHSKEKLKEREAMLNESRNDSLTNEQEENKSNLQVTDEKSTTMDEQDKDENKEHDTSELAKKGEQEVMESVEEISMNMSVEDLERLANIKSANKKEDYDQINIDGQSQQRKNHPLDDILSQLSASYSVAQADELAQKFCYFNSKSNRQYLIRHLYEVSRNQMELLPYYSRFIATLNMVLNDIGEGIVQLLRQEFYRLLRRKDQMRLESRIRNIRYLGELTKFRVAPPGVIFNCWHALLLDFRNYSIHSINTLIETCGRWLYRNPITHEKCKKFLERMMSLKTSKYLENNLKNMIDNAYYHCIPPVQSAVVEIPKRPLLERYIRKLLYLDLTKRKVGRIYNSLCKLNFDDECIEYLIDAFFDITQVKFDNINAIANVLYGLGKYHSFVVDVVDLVLEEIRCGLELNDYRHHQRRLTYIKYLAELYNCRLVNRQIILDTLYLLITFGSDNVNLDAPNDFFRVRLICKLLENLNSSFDYGSNRKRLDYFLLHFQRYLHSKDFLSFEVDHMAKQIFKKLRPKYILLSSLDEILISIKEMEKNRNVAKDRQMLKADYIANEKLALPPIDEMIDENEVDNNSQVYDDDDNNSQVYDDNDDDDDDDNDDNNTNDDDDDENNSQMFNDHDSNDSNDEEDENVENENEDNVTNNDNESGDESSDEDFERGQTVDEDDDLMAEYEKLVQESIDSRKYDQPGVNMAAANTFAAGGGGLFGQARNDTSKVRIERKDNEEMISFRFVARKANKNRKSEILIPLESDLATYTLEAERKQRAEQEKLKEAVLLAMQKDDDEFVEQTKTQAFFRKNPDQKFNRGKSSSSGQKKGHNWTTKDLQQLEKDIQGSLYQQRRNNNNDNSNNYSRVANDNASVAHNTNNHVNNRNTNNNSRNTKSNSNNRNTSNTNNNSNNRNTTNNNSNNRNITNNNSNNRNTKNNSNNNSNRSNNNKKTR